MGEVEGDGYLVDFVQLLDALGDGEGDEGGLQVHGVWFGHFEGW